MKKLAQIFRIIACAVSLFCVLWVLIIHMIPKIQWDGEFIFKNNVVSLLFLLFFGGQALLTALPSRRIHLD